jgi:protein-S-isoprenylcysteine O-methyltransferase Ste14
VIPIKAVVGFLVYLFAVPALLFVSAGTIAWPMGWVFVALFVGSIAASRMIVWRRRPDLLAERARFTEAEGALPRDRPLAVFVGLVGPMLLVVVAGLDHRFGWPPALAAWLIVTGVLFVALGYGLAVWAMSVNPFFSSVVRIQTDRGHTVVASGPYRFVRHPAYAGGLLSAMAMPLMLDALWALLPGVAMAAALVLRAELEDNVLHLGLPGYRDYAGGTRSRLIPRLW